MINQWNNEFNHSFTFTVLHMLSFKREERLDFMQETTYKQFFFGSYIFLYFVSIHRLVGFTNVFLILLWLQVQNKIKRPR